MSQNDLLSWQLILIEIKKRWMTSEIVLNIWILSLWVSGKLVYFLVASPQTNNKVMFEGMSLLIKSFYAPWDIVLHCDAHVSTPNQIHFHTISWMVSEPIQLCEHNWNFNSNRSPGNATLKLISTSYCFIIISIKQLKFDNNPMLMMFIWIWIVYHHLFALI